jgi:arsenical pump membrane protein
MDASQISALAVFVIVVLLVVVLATYPLRVKFGRVGPCVTIGYSWPPVAGVLVLLAAQVMSPHDVGRGITGNKNIQPFGIAIIFMSLAFMCGSLDMTGVFAWLALKLTKASNGSGQLLFISYYLLSSVTTCFTSNDIVVMTLTPIICYFSAAAKADPIPFLVAEFTAANLWSMALFIGNPTNIIAAQAYNMTFIGYSKWMILPTVGERQGPP